MESASVETGPGQTLNDLQNYLVHFNKEIETADQPGAESQSGSESASISVDVVAAKTEPGSQFTTGFYSEQQVIPTSLGASVQELSVMTPTAAAVETQNVAGNSDVNSESDQIENESKHQDESADSLENYHDYIASLTGEKIDGEELTVEPVTMAQELAVNSMMDGLVAHTSAGKMIRIVSVGKDGQMQLIGEDMPAGISISNLQLKQEPPSELDNISSTIDSKHSGVIDGTDPVAVLASVATNTSNVNNLQNRNELNDAQLVALQNSADSSQPQLVAVQSGSGESMQIIGGPEGITGQGNQVMFNSFQTVTIVPSEVNQESGIVNYVLIVSPDGDKGNEKHIQLDMAGYDIKDESLREVTEEIVQEDGTTHRVLKITPQNFFPGSQTQLMCNICNYTSPKRYLLSRHMKTHSEDRPYKCNICERGFKTLASLTNHVNTHTGTRPHKCKDCESSFTTSGELVRHVRYRHTFEKPHKCPECDYASVELSKLKRHIRMHTGERPYQCQHCSYASPDTYKLKRHLRIHTGEKPYECDQCHARFTQSNSLKAHKLIHSGDKPVFQCDLCPTTCGRKTDLKIHYQKLHTSEHPLQCRKCGQNFPDRYTYKLHLKQHDGEKCFKCDECDYAALSQRHLESHMLVHSGEKPFECSGCDQTFRQKQLLRRHRNIHHTPDYVKPAPKSKSYSCPDCDKTFAHRGNLARHLLELHGKHITFAESEEETDVCELPTISAQHILESNIMQEWRDGKLGNSPQVVIVHPDGRVEEVTPKLQAPPDRSVDDLLEAMSSHTAGSDRLEQENRDIREDMKTKKTEEVKLHSFDDVNPGNKTENKIGDTEVKSGSLKMSPRGVDVESSVTLHQLNVESVGLHKQVKKITAQCQMKEAGTQATIDSDSEDDSFKPVIVSCRTVNANESKSKTVHSNRQKSPAVNNDCFKIKTISSEDVQEDLIQSRSMGLPSSDIGLINSSVTVSDKSMNSDSIMPIAPLHDNSGFASYPEVDVVDTGNSSIHTSSQRFIISKTSASPCQSSTTAELQPVLNTTTPHAMHSTISLSPSKNSTEFQGIDTGTISGNVQLETATEDDESGSASTYMNTTKTPVLKVATNSNIVFIKQEANAKNILKSQSPDRLTRSMKRKEIELEASPAKRTRRATTSDSK